MSGFARKHPKLSEIFACAAAVGTVVGVVVADAAIAVAGVTVGGAAAPLAFGLTVVGSALFGGPLAGGAYNKVKNALKR